MAAKARTELSDSREQQMSPSTTSDMTGSTDGDQPATEDNVAGIAFARRAADTYSSVQSYSGRKDTLEYFYD